MLFFDVQENRMLRTVEAQSAIAFITFCNKIFSVWLPMRVCTKNRNLRANIMARAQPAAAKNVRRHRRGGGLAMHSGNHYPPLDLHHRGERFGTTDHCNSQLDC